MATTAQLAVPTETTGPVARWHLLSLDAPTVAALWTWFVARVCHVNLPLASPMAMALTVWILYATDRLLDARGLDRSRSMGSKHAEWDTNTNAREKLEARHLFHHRHRHRFVLGMAIAAIGLVALLPSLNPAAIRLYFIEGALLLAWFLVLHATRSAHRLPKEMAVGLFFSAAIFIPTVAHGPFLGEPRLRTALLPSAALFAALCSLNCLFIYAWEHTASSAHRTQPGAARPAHPTTRLALAHLNALTVSVAIACIGLAILDSQSPARLDQRLVPAACAMSAILLLLLDRKRAHLSQLNLRAVADLALLTPILLLPFLR